MSRLYIKSAVRKASAWIYYLSGSYLRAHRSKVLILMYHRVLSEKEVRRRYVQPGMYVLDHVFDAQMRFLKNQFQAISFAELLDRWKKNNWDTTTRYCVVTLDDGWRDNYQYAYPLLNKYGVPATIFLATDFIGTRRWFWPEKMSYLLEMYYNPVLSLKKKESLSSLLNHYMRNLKLVTPARVFNNTRPGEKIDNFIETCKLLPQEQINELIEKMRIVLDLDFPHERVLLNWEEVAQMSQNGISFGSHSSSHQILTKLPLQEAIAEIVESKCTLLKKHVNYVPVFCYPNGNYNREIQSLVRESGYEAAVGAQFSSEGESPEDPFAIHRIGVHNDISSTIPLYSLHLSGCYNRAKYSS